MSYRIVGYTPLGQGHLEHSSTHSCATEECGVDHLVNINVEKGTEFSEEQHSTFLQYGHIGQLAFDHETSVSSIMSQWKMSLRNATERKVTRKIVEAAGHSKKRKTEKHGVVCKGGTGIAGLSAANKMKPCENIKSDPDAFAYSDTSKCLFRAHLRHLIKQGESVQRRNDLRCLYARGFAFNARVVQNSNRPGKIKASNDPVFTIKEVCEIFQSFKTLFCIYTKQSGGGCVKPTTIFIRRSPESMSESHLSLLSLSLDEYTKLYNDDLYAKAFGSTVKKEDVDSFREQLKQFAAEFFDTIDGENGGASPYQVGASFATSATARSSLVDVVVKQEKSASINETCLYENVAGEKMVMIDLGSFKSVGTNNVVSDDQRWILVSAETLVPNVVDKFKLDTDLKNGKLVLKVKPTVDKPVVQRDSLLNAYTATNTAHGFSVESSKRTSPKSGIGAVNNVSQFVRSPHAAKLKRLNAAKQWREDRGLKKTIERNFAARRSRLRFKITSNVPKKLKRVSDIEYPHRMQRSIATSTFELQIR